jgi:hypothetical protein
MNECCLKRPLGQITDRDDVLVCISQLQLPPYINLMVIVELHEFCDNFSASKKQNVLRNKFQTNQDRTNYGVVTNCKFQWLNQKLISYSPAISYRLSASSESHPPVLMIPGCFDFFCCHFNTRPPP